MKRSTVAYVALGSNLGDREGYLSFAREQLAAVAGLQITRLSDVEETSPLGGLDQPSYLNQMVMIRCDLEARQLLSTCHDVERLAGRRRTTKWASRTLDLDIVRFGSLMCDLPDLVLPHPGLRDRPFWANEIARMEAHG